MYAKTKLKNERNNIFTSLATIGFLSLILFLSLEWILNRITKFGVIAKDLRKAVLAANVAIWSYYFLLKSNSTLFSPPLLATITTLSFNLLGFFYGSEKNFMLAHSLCSVILICYCLPINFSLEMGILNLIFVMLCYCVEIKTSFDFLITGLICIEIAILADFLSREKSTKARYKKMLLRKRIKIHMIAKRLEKILHTISDKNLTNMLTRSVKSISSKNVADEANMASFSLKDYRKLIDMGTDIKHKIDEAMVLMRILKRLTLSEKLPARYFLKTDMGVFLTNYKHGLSHANNEKIKFELPNNSFSVNICPPLFNCALDILTEWALKQGQSVDISISFEPIARKVYITYGGVHMHERLLENGYSHLKNKTDLRFVAMILNDAKASINYCEIRAKRMGFVIQFPSLR